MTDILYLAVSMYSIKTCQAVGLDFKACQSQWQVSTLQFSNMAIHPHISVHTNAFRLI